jgi:hypothetical protein
MEKRMRERFSKHRHVAGVGMIEVILAIGVLLLLVPVVYRLGFRELAEVKYLSISKQLKQVHKAVMNYVSVNKQGGSNGTSGMLSTNVRQTLISESGLDDSVSTDVTDGMMLKYSQNADGAVEAFAVLNLDKVGFDSDLAFKQTLLYTGDIAGYVEGNFVYSITGAWQKNLSDITPSVPGVYAAVLKVDDNDLESEYSSSFYLYRNSQGGSEGNTMNVNFNMDGHDIKNFGTVSAGFVPENGPGKVSELNFNTATSLLGGMSVSGGMILKGIVRFGTEGEIKTPHMNIGGSSRMLKLLLSNAELSETAASLRAEVNVTGTSSFNALSLQNMSMTNTSSDLVVTGTPTGSSTERLQVEAVNKVDVGDLTTNVITVKNGYFSAGGISTSGGNLNMGDGKDVRVYNVGRSIPCDINGISSCGLNLNNVTNGFDVKIPTLMNAINNMH